MATTERINKRRELVRTCIMKMSFPSQKDIVDFVKRYMPDENIAADTIEKDRKAICDQGIQIRYNSKEKGYYIDEEDLSQLSLNRLSEIQNVIEAIKNAKNAGAIIQMEQQRAQNTELLPTIVAAINDNYRIEFTYEKYWEGKISKRIVEPLGLKEFKNRWYLVGKNKGESTVKTFSLDRISDLYVLTEHFTKAKDFSLDKYFAYSFGIMNGLGDPIEAILSFTPMQGHYIKSLPLHLSQKIIVDDAQECRISLQIWPTYDFIKELVSYGDSVKVISPTSLEEQVRDFH